MSTVMILDANPLTRSGLRQLLSEQNTLRIHSILEYDPRLGQVNIIRQIEDSLPDMVILSADYPSLSGMGLCKQIVRIMPWTKVVLVSENPADSDSEMLDAVKAGAAAYLRCRELNTTEFLAVIGKCADGEYPINEQIAGNPSLAANILREFQEITALGKPVDDFNSPLTRKELEVLRLIAEGNSNKQIAQYLGISDQTIKNHVSSILRKINANYRAHAVFIAIRDGLIMIDQAGLPRCKTSKFQLKTDKQLVTC